MEFRLMYRGNLKANGTINDKHEIRKYFYPQLKKLWGYPPLNDDEDDFLNPIPQNGKISVIESIGEFQFAPLVTDKLNLCCTLDIVMLRPEGPQGLIKTGGDIDNRLKTLFDGLRMPLGIQEIPINEKATLLKQSPFFCLLRDDALITSVNITCDRLLSYRDNAEVFLLIYVKVKATGLMFDNISIVA